MSKQVDKRVLHLRSSGDLLGAEQVVTSLCEHSAAFGYRSSLALTHDHGDEPPRLLAVAQSKGIDSHVVSSRSRFDLRPIAQLRRLIEQLNIDILHCHGYREDFYAIASRTGIAKVATNHLWKRTSAALRVYAALDARLIRRFDRVVAVSREILVELQSLGLAEPQLAYIPNGVDLTRFEPGAVDLESVSHLREELGLADHQTVVVSISSLTIEKGHAQLLRCFRDLVAKNEEVVLLVVGAGPQLAPLRKLTEQLGIPQRVQFLGRRQDIPEILHLADIFVLPSLKEGLPIALLEAMASGTACVATDVGDVPRIIRAGLTGVLVPRGDGDALRDALLELARSADTRRQYSEAGRDLVLREFSAERMTENYCALYDRLLGS